MKINKRVLRFFHPVMTSSDLMLEANSVTRVAGIAYRISRAADGSVAATSDEPGSRPHVLDRFGSIWLADFTEAPNAEPDEDHEKEGFQRVGTARVVFPAPLHVAFDNFSEDEHTPWVHSFLGWKASDANEIQFKWKPRAECTEVYYSGKQRPHPLTPALLVRWGDSFHNRWVTTFSPIRTVYTLHWTAPDGSPRPVTSRFSIYFVPETPSSTILHIISYAKISAKLAFMMPVVRAVVPQIGASEVYDDQKFIHHVAETPFEFTGMRLGRFDLPLVHNRKLMKRLYLG
jgi:hypothetical protein